MNAQGLRWPGCSPTAMQLPGSRALIACRPVALPAPPQLVQRMRRSVQPTAVAAEQDKVLDLNLGYDKEEELKKFRVVFDFDKWASHRSTKRYWRHLGGLFNSRIVAALRPSLVAVGALATFVCVYETLLADGSLPSMLPNIAVREPVAFNLSSFALSLLLVFRTNSSYGRFDEARKFWGGVVNRSRDITRQAATFFCMADRSLLEAFVRWQAAFPWVLKNHLRATKTTEEDLKNILLPDELDLLLASPHGPNTVLIMLTELGNRAAMTPAQRHRMDENMTFFADMVGGCERLLRTPIPVSYTRHTSRFLSIWLFFLPFTIYEKCGWATIPSSVLLAFVLLAIEEIGVSIEEPFYILPLEAISNTIATNVQQTLKQTDDVHGLLAPANVRQLVGANGNGAK